MPPTKVQSSPETVSDEDVKRYQECFAQEKELEKAQECLAALAIKYESRLRNYLLRKGHSIDDAYDILQEAYLRACSYRESYDPQRGFYNWYFKIVQNIAFDRSRREGRFNTSVSLETDATLRVMTVASSERFSQAKILYHQMRQLCANDHERKLLDTYFFHHCHSESWVTLRNQLNWPKTPQGLQKACEKLVNRILQKLNGE